MALLGSVLYNTASSGRYYISVKLFGLNTCAVIYFLLLYSAMQSLLERLRETKERVTAQNDELEGMISNISKATNESCLLRERVGMTHRSLTLIEMRQEKVMREALYENGKIF